MENIKIDFITNTIIVTKEFYTEAQNYGSDEYNLLKEIQRDNPAMKVSMKPTTRRTNKRRRANESKGLNYRYMRKFISVMDEANLDTFEQVILHFEGLYKENFEVYQSVKDWFLDNYPDHKDMVIASAPQRVA